MFRRHSLDQVVKELKQILKRDFNRRMIENTAYKLFEKWWDEQAEEHKVRDRLSQPIHPLAVSVFHL